MTAPLEDAAQRGLAHLRRHDPTLYDLLEREQIRQRETLAMVAASSVADSSVLACEGSAAGNMTTEGYPGARFHAGGEVVDIIERLAVARAMKVFGARYANVQPHSGSTANQLLMCALLQPGDVLMGLDLAAGGHLTHGARVSFTGRYFRAVGYGVDPDGWLDYEQVERLAHEHRPRLIVCGASAYPRAIDFARFRAVADAVGAYLLADISHIAGLVAAGVHASPVDVAHFTTTSTYKQLYGPRGGLILMGPDADGPGLDGRRSLADLVQAAVFPFFQGTPRMNTIAAKARALAVVDTPAFGRLARRVAADARALAETLAGCGWSVLTGGTDNHLVLVDVGRRGLTGLIAERALESCGVIVNKNKIPGDPRPAHVTSGVRFGTNTLALRGMDPTTMVECALLIDRTWRAVAPLGEADYRLDPRVRNAVSDDVAALCRRYPLPDDLVHAETALTAARTS